MSFSKAYLRVLSLGSGQVVMFLLQRESEKYCSCQKLQEASLCPMVGQDDGDLFLAGNTRKPHMFIKEAQSLMSRPG
jgi:hypothetical protein